MEAAFGYPLAVDPATFVGDAVEKGEGNGLHDGRLVACPVEPAPGKAYQRIIKTEGEDGWAYDLRTACVARKPVVVFLKKKPAAARFSIQTPASLSNGPRKCFRPPTSRRSKISAKRWSSTGRPRRAARAANRAALRGRRQQDRHRPRRRAQLAIAPGRRAFFRKRCAAMVTVS